jgi:hypothetical protein
MASRSSQSLSSSRSAGEAVGAPVSSAPSAVACIVTRSAADAASGFSFGASVEAGTVMAVSITSWSRRAGGRGRTSAQTGRCRERDGATLRFMRSRVGLKRLAQLLIAATFLCSLAAAARASVSYTSATIPSNLAFTAMASSPTGLVLSGTTTLDGDQGALCLMARANARTLALSGIVEPFCDSPLLSGRSVVAVQRHSGSMLTSVRIAHLSPTGHVEVGPVVVRFEEASDTHLESVYTAGSLWL